MKKPRNIMFRLLCLAAVFLSFNNASAQSSYLKVSASYPFPNSGHTFEKRYIGIMSVSVIYDKFMSKNLFIGGGTTYDFFYSKYPDIVKTGISFISPAARFGFRGDFKKFTLSPALNVCYAFIRFSNKSAPEVRDYNKSGFGLKPALDISYRINQRFLAGCSVSYNYLFVKLMKDVYFEEDASTRYFTPGLTFTYCW